MEEEKEKKKASEDKKVEKDIKKEEKKEEVKEEVKKEEQKKNDQEEKKVPPEPIQSQVNIVNNNVKKPIYTKWWFWLIIVIVSIGIIIFGMICLSIIATCGEESGITSSTNTTNGKNKDKEENPYKITTDYDGIYEFDYDPEANDIENQAKGYLSLKNGTCNIIYTWIKGDKSYNEKLEGQGYYGINEEDNNLYLKIKRRGYFSDTMIFKCSIENKDIVAKQVDGKSDFTAYSPKKDVKFIYKSEEGNINALYDTMMKSCKEQVETKQKAKKEQDKKEYQEKCKVYTFEQMARNPDNFKGTYVKLTGEVIQTIYSDSGVDLRVNITKEGKYSTWYTDTIYVTYIPEKGEDKILEDDIITIYGQSMGDYTYTSTLGAPITLPWINAKYITISQ